MTRNLSVGMSTAVEQGVIIPVWFVRLDFKTDPLYAWTGLQDVIPSSGDPRLDGFTYMGLGNIGEISSITDTKEGSQAVQLSMPGTGADEELLIRVQDDYTEWQFRMGYIWLGLLDTTTYALINTPTRVKTGRLDKFDNGIGSSKGVMRINLESNQAWASEPLNSKYSEQKEIDPTDISQDYVWDLANKTALIGVQNNVAGTPISPFSVSNPAGYASRF